MQISHLKRLEWFQLLILLLILNVIISTCTVRAKSIESKTGIVDRSIIDFSTQRVCWWREICKEEFRMKFQCRCPGWMYCRSPGKNYNAYCSITDSGYVWDQSSSDQQLDSDAINVDVDNSKITF